MPTTQVYDYDNGTAYSVTGTTEQIADKLEQLGFDREDAERDRIVVDKRAVSGPDAIANADPSLVRGIREQFKNHTIDQLMQYVGVGDIVKREIAREMLESKYNVDWTKGRVTPTSALAPGSTPAGRVTPRGGGASGVPQDTGGGAVPVPVPDFLPPIRPEVQRRIDLSQSREGRAQLYREYLSGLGEAPGIVQRQRQAQFNPYSRLFDIGQGLGDFGPETTFRQTLPEGLGRPDPGFVQTQLERVRDLLAGDRPEGERGDYYAGLQSDPTRQFGMLFDTGLGQTMAPRFRPGVRRRAAENFGRAGDVAIIQAGLGQTAQDPFGGFLEQGTDFAGPSSDTYRQAIGNAAFMLGSPFEGLSAPSQQFQSTFSMDRNLPQEKLQERAERQFQMAVQSRIRDIPWQFREGWLRDVRRSFDAWLGGNTAGGDFLPAFQAQGYRFNPVGFG